MSPKRNSEEWSEMIARQKASGESAKVWCAANGINYHTFVDRASRMRKDNASAWVKVQELPPIEKEIQVKVGIFTISVTEGFSETGLVHVCKALMSLC